MARFLLPALLSLLLVIPAGLGAGAGNPQEATPEHSIAITTVPSMDTAQRLFYVGHYEDASAMAMRLREVTPDDLSTYELRTSALHFLLKRQLGDAKDKEAALKSCQPCVGLLADMKADVEKGQELARARLKTKADDDEALFYLGKIDLNHVWLHLGTLSQRTGWNEYWEARHSLDAVLKSQPTHVRARVARAWIDYIVDTRVPLGLKWILGGGSKKRALSTARAAASVDAETYVKAEAGFALWEMLVREKQISEAVKVAEGLALDFPENRELVRFLASNKPKSGA